MMPMEYITYARVNYKPSWMRTERYEYCEHVVRIKAKRAFLQHSVKKLFDKITHRQV